MKSSAAGARDGVTIGELAARFGLAPHVLRHWETVGLLRPHRLANGWRRYGAEHALRVAVILRAKDAGLSLDQMRDAFDADDREGRQRLLAGHLTMLDAQIARAQTARAMVAHALDCTAEHLTECPAFQRAVGADSALEVPCRG